MLTDVSDSVSHLFDSFIEPGLPPVAKHDTNDFRRNRFYTKVQFGLHAYYFDVA